MIRFCFLITGLLFIASAARAEPLVPLLRPRTLDSLKQALLLKRETRSRVDALLMLSNDQITRYEELEIDPVDAEQYIRQASRLSTTLGYADGQVQSLCAQGRLAGIRGDRKTAETLLRQVLAHYVRQRMPSRQAATWYYLGQVYGRNAEELPEKISCYEQAMRLFKQAGQVADQAYMLKNIADMHLLQGHPAQAEQELMQVLAMYRSIHYPNLHYTYDLLASIYHNSLNNYGQALKYMLLTLESATASKDSTYLSSFHLSLGVLYDELKQWQTALTHYHKALDLFARDNSAMMVHNIAHSITSVLIAHDSPQAALTFYKRILRQHPLPPASSEWSQVYMTLADCYSALKQNRLAEYYYLKMLATRSKKSPLDNAAIAAHIKTGTFFVKVQKYDQARYYLGRAMDMLKEAGYVRGTPSVHLQLFKVDSAQQHYPAAIAHYQKYKALSDSIFNERKSQQIANLEISYNTRKKEQDIALLTRQNQLQQARIRAKDLQRNSIIAGSALLILLSALLFNRYRLKQRSNRLLEAKQVEINLKNSSLEQILQEKEHLLAEKEWMLKEIHHRVKNNMQIIISMLNAQADFLEDPQALTAIMDSRNRVNAMALIHQKLYQTDSLSQVNMPEFVRELTDHLLSSYSLRTSVQTDLHIDDVSLSVTQAIPIGLIINEAVTNSLKYAFPEQPSGMISVTLNAPGPAICQLTISDNGTGFPDGLDTARSNTLGLLMIRGLSQQLGGKLTIRNENGVRIQLVFTAA